MFVPLFDTTGVIQRRRLTIRTPRIERTKSWCCVWPTRITRQQPHATLQPPSPTISG